MTSPDIELVDLRPFPFCSDEHPDAIAAGEFKTGDATICFCLALNGSVWLAPGVHLPERALLELQRLAQAAQLWRLQQPETRGSWHVAGVA